MNWSISTNHGGMRLVATLLGRARFRDTYIAVTKDVRPDRCEVAEVVKNGHVVEYVNLQPRYAAETIIKLMRFYGRN